MQCVGARASLPRALGSKCAPTAPSRAPAHGRSLKRDARGRSVSVRRMRWQTDARASHPPPHSFARARARELPVHKFSPTFPRMRPAFPCCQRAHPGLPRAGATRGVRAGTSSPYPPPPHPLPPPLHLRRAYPARAHHGRSRGTGPRPTRAQWRAGARPRSGNRRSAPTKRTQNHIVRKSDRAEQACIWNRCASSTPDRTALAGVKVRTPRARACLCCRHATLGQLRSITVVHAHDERVNHKMTRTDRVRNGGCTVRTSQPVAAVTHGWVQKRRARAAAGELVRCPGRVGECTL